MSMKHRRSDTDRRKLKYSKKLSSSATFSTKNPTWADWDRTGAPAVGRLKSKMSLAGPRHGWGGGLMLIRIYSGRENMNCIHGGWDRVDFRDFVNWKMHVRVP